MDVIFHDFQFSCHIPRPTVCVSHFPRLSVFLPYPRSYSVCSSFCTISVFLNIFQFLQCIFLIFQDFNSFLSYSIFYSVCVSFSKFFSFLAIFQILQCVCFIFLMCQFSLHISVPTVCISHFSCF